jgi:integrase
MQKEKFEEIFRTDLSPGTASQYLWHLRQYQKFLEENDETLETVSDPGGSIREYTYSKTMDVENPWSKSLVNVGFYALKRYWEKFRGIPIEKRFFINMGAETSHEPRILDRPEVQKIWVAAHKDLDETEELMIHVGWEAALRSGELVTLKGQDFFEDGTLEARVLKTKGAKKRVSLSPETYQRVKNLITTDGRHLFIREAKSSWAGRRRYTSLEWSCLFHRWTDEVLGEGGVRWHDFARHTRLTHYAEDTRSFLAVLQLSGHQNPAVCRQYFERAKIEVPELKAIKAQEWGWLK